MNLFTFDDRKFNGKWHRWFAWHPVMAWDGGRDSLVWLETVWRKWDEEPHPYHWASCFIYLHGQSVPAEKPSLKLIKS
jgi:hypothetical protein